MVTLYGIPNCDTCRAARKALEAAGKTVAFRDVRAEPLTLEVLERFCVSFGESLINRRSATWRGLSEEARESEPVALLTSHPTLMKRPVIEDGATLTLGWDAAAQAAHLT
jgi:Spx/MgsR family transcriptional regulator